MGGTGSEEQRGHEVRGVVLQRIERQKGGQVFGQKGIHGFGLGLLLLLQGQKHGQIGKSGGGCLGCGGRLVHHLGLRGDHGGERGGGRVRRGDRFDLEWHGDN